MRVLISVVAGTMVIWSCSTLYGATYQWEDDQGGIHFTDNAASIPSQYQKKVRQRESIRGEERAVLPAPEQEPRPTTQEKKPGEPLYDGQTAAAWQQRFIQLKQNLAAAASALSEKQGSLKRAHHAYTVSLGTSQIKDDKDNKDPKVKSYALNTIGAKRKAYFDLLAEIPQYEERVKELEGQLAALQTEADAAGLPVELR